jgi:hypothetical protein
VVSGSLSIGTRHDNLLTASITLSSPGTTDAGTFQLPGEAADPGSTLRPLQYYEVKPASILPTVLPVLSRAETGIMGAPLSTGTAFPARSKLSAMSVAASEKTG